MRDPVVASFNKFRKSEVKGEDADDEQSSYYFFEHRLKFKNMAAVIIGVHHLFLNFYYDTRKIYYLPQLVRAQISRAA